MTVQASRTVPLNSLKLDHKFWSNPRSFTGLAPKEIDELGADIKDRGIQVPLNVLQVLHNGTIVNLVLDGQRRVLAGLEVLSKSSPIPVADYSAEPVELTAELADKILLDMLAVGQKRAGLASFELSEVAEKLRNRDRTLLDIANAIGRSESWVSKILKARNHASPKLMLRWRKAEITDEQFKELAEVKDPEKQAEAVKEVVEARREGDKTEARVRSKEIKETAKQSKPHKDGMNGVPRKVVSGPQEDLFKDKSEKAPKRLTPSRIALDEMASLADRRPPTHDYVKGIIDGVRYATGDLTPDKFGKPWGIYLARIDGSGKKKTARAKKERKPGKGKARRSKVGKKATKATRRKK